MYLSLFKAIYSTIGDHVLQPFELVSMNKAVNLTN